MEPQYVSQLAAPRDGRVVELKTQRSVQEVVDVITSIRACGVPRVLLKDILFQASSIVYDKIRSDIYYEYAKYTYQKM